MQKRIRLSVVLLAAGLALASCGTVSNATPARARTASNSFAPVGQQSAVSLTFSVGVTASQAQHLDKNMTATEAHAISTGSLFIDVQSGHGEALNSKQFQSDSSDSLAIGLKISSTTPIEIRYVGQNLYLHLDSSSFLRALGLPTTDASKFTTALHAADQYVPGLDALGQGKWVEISHASLMRLGTLVNHYVSVLGGSTATTTQPNQSQALAAVSKLRSDLLTAFKNNATYKDLGNTDGRTHYQLNIAVKSLVQQAASAIKTDITALPGGAALSARLSGVNNAGADIPPGTRGTLDLYVQGNKAQEIDFDLNQINHDLGFPVPLRLVIGSNTNITAPSGATPLNLSKVPQLISGLPGNVGPGSGS